MISKEELADIREELFREDLHMLHLDYLDGMINGAKMMAEISVGLAEGFDAQQAEAIREACSFGLVSVARWVRRQREMTMEKAAHSTPTVA